MIKFIFNLEIFKKSDVVFFRVPIIEPPINDSQIYYVRNLINKYGEGPFEIINIKKNHPECLHPQIVFIKTHKSFVKISGLCLSKEKPRLVKSGVLFLRKMFKRPS